jgi:hypothetical protein
MKPNTGSREYRGIKKISQHSLLGILLNQEESQHSLSWVQHSVMRIL